ncbi:MAG: MFS transporter [Caldilineaceae bacterium]|nr:MFS transporter [Caldilineaceae bacterium]
MPHSAGTATTPIFVRDRFTWLAYGMLAYFAYLQAALGPAIPFLRQELNLSYTVAGFHASAMALGMIVSGLSADRAAARWGRRPIFWIGGAGMAMGAILLTFANRSIFTVLGAGLMGALGGMLIVTLQSGLSDRHGERRATAFTESNVVASMGALAAPSLIGAFQAATLGWRWALLVMVLGWVVAFFQFRRVLIPEREDHSSHAAGKTSTRAAQRLPAQFWLLWGVIFTAVAMEWCMGFWGAAFMQSSTGLTPTGASAAMSIFFGAIVIGRFMGSRLTRRYESMSMLLTALLLVGIGFPFFWLSPSIPLALGGLFVTGLGVANLFPLTLAAAVSVASHRADTVSARISLAAGVAIFLAPQILGALADQVGIQWAYGVVPILLAAAIAITLMARRAIHRR